MKNQEIQLIKHTNEYQNKLFYLGEGRVFIFFIY